MESVDIRKIEENYYLGIQIDGIVISNHEDLE